MPLYFSKSDISIINTTFLGDKIMRFSNEAMRDVLLFLEEKVVHKHDDDLE